MKAIYSFNTTPFFERNPEATEFVMRDHEILVLMLSVMSWRKKNGTAKLYTDSKGMEFFVSRGLHKLWDGGIDIFTFDNSKRKIDRKTFWAASKIEAIEVEKPPFVHMDFDFIFWDNIDKYINGKRVVAAHSEKLNKFLCYVDKEKLAIKDDYWFDPLWDWTIPAINMSMSYFADEQVRDMYVKEAFRFMENNFVPNLNDDNNIQQMIFAEQRIPAMIYHQKRIALGFLIDYEHDDMDTQTIFTHIWGLKKTLDESYTEKFNFCKACVIKIKQEFPEYEDMIGFIPEVTPYL